MGVPQAPSLLMFIGEALKRGRSETFPFLGSSKLLVLGRDYFPFQVLSTPVVLAACIKLYFLSLSSLSRKARVYCIATIK